MWASCPIRPRDESKLDLISDTPEPEPELEEGGKDVRAESDSRRSSKADRAIATFCKLDVDAILGAGEWGWLMTPGLPLFAGVNDFFVCRGVTFGEAEY